MCERDSKKKNEKKRDFGLCFIFLLFIIKNAFFMIKNDLFFILEQHYIRNACTLQFDKRGSKIMFCQRIPV